LDFNESEAKMTDPIADMLTRIRNAVSANHTRVDMPASKLKVEIARILQDEGYIQGFRLGEEPADRVGRQPRQVIRLFLKYGPRGERVISGIQRISRPGRRVYLGVEAVPTVLGGLGTNILTTSRGVMTGRAARKAGVGGEVLCNVW
jgi:small subunit ribosomal protein S8